MTRARDLADSADKDISGTLTVDDLTASGEALIGTSTSPSSSDVKLAINSSGGGFAQFNFNGGAGSAIGSPAASTLAFYTTTGNIGSDVYTERMRIDSSGNVGIGATPSTQLTLQSTTPFIRLQDDQSTVSDGTNMGGIEFRTADSSVVGASRITAKIRVEGDGNFNATAKAPSRMIFSTHATSGTDPVDALTIDSSGNAIVGGTSAQTSDAVTLMADGEVTAAGFYFSNNIGSAMNDTGIRRATTSTLVFDTGSTERMRIDSDGHITAPYQSAFSAFRSNDLNNISLNSAVSLSFVSESFDNNSDFNGTTYTAPVDGRYMLSAHLRLEDVDTAAAFYQLRIDTSNRNYLYTIDPNFTADLSYLSLSLSVLADMDAGDGASVKVSQSGGSTQTDIHTESFFSGYLAC